MESRKVQVTGGSTYTVSIPKDWATENGVSAGSVVEFHAEEDLLLLVPSTEAERSEGVVDVSGLESDQGLVRSIMTMYVGGFDVIRVETSETSPDRRRLLREVAQGLVGMEIVEETGSHVVMQDLLDPSELSVRDALTRMRLVSLAMLTDAAEALLEGDDDLAGSVVARDDEVDRLWYMISRVFRTVLRDPTAATKFGIPRETVFDYHTGARQLERIGDHAVKIAGVAEEVSPPAEPQARALAGLVDPAVTVPEVATDALLSDDVEEVRRLAAEAHDTGTAVEATARDVDEQIRELNDPQRARRLGLVVDSLSRAGDYGVNVAETALQKAAPGRDGSE